MQVIAQKAVFMCPQCDQTREAEVPPLDSPPDVWLKCYSCGYVLFLMELILQHAV